MSVVSKGQERRPIARSGPLVLDESGLVRAGLNRVVGRIDGNCPDSRLTPDGIRAWGELAQVWAERTRELGAIGRHNGARR